MMSKPKKSEEEEELLMSSRNRDWQLELCCSRTKEHAVKLLLYTYYFMAFLVSLQY
jgi:hypothetical protein